MSAPLSDAIIVSLARMVDDAQSETREPSHSDIEFLIVRAGLASGDPKARGQTVGKAKRIRSTLYWAMENSFPAGQGLVGGLIAHIRGFGGFRASSPNYVGAEAITDAISAFRAESYELTLDGELRPLILNQLAGAELTAALETYVRRARRGTEDAALVVGTGKDLLEATAAHILIERNGSYPSGANFPALLGLAFVAVDLITPKHTPTPGEPPQHKVQRAMFELACAINTLRNKVGTGHGRPWLPNVSGTEARIATECMGAIAELMLDAHRAKL